MAKILIAHVDSEMQWCMGGYGHRLRTDNYDVVEISVISRPSEDWKTKTEANFKLLEDLLTGNSVEDRFDLVIVFDEYDRVLKRIRSLIPTKVPVFYVDIYRETKPVEGFTWLCGSVLPSNLLEEVDKLLKIDVPPV